MGIYWGYNPLILAFDPNFMDIQAHVPFAPLFFGAGHLKDLLQRIFAVGYEVGFLEPLAPPVDEQNFSCFLASFHFTKTGKKRVVFFWNRLH